MDEAKEMTLDFKALDVEACRICLATDVKLYSSIQDTHLGICLESIGGFTKSYEGLPSYVCYECAPILIKCHKLKEKCKTAEATLLDIFKENGQVNKALIQEQKKTKLSLQSSLDSYLLLNYFYIKYDDDSNTSDFVNMESDPNEKINIKLQNEIKEECSDEVSDAELLKMVNEEFDKVNDVKADKDRDSEVDKDSDVEAIELDIPLVKIESDDEKMGDDFLSLQTYKVKIDNHGLQPHPDEIPQYRKTRKVMGLAKKGKKKKKNLFPENTSPVTCKRRRYFNDRRNPMLLRPTPMEYSYNQCPDTSKHVDEAREDRKSYAGMYIDSSKSWL